MTKRNALTTRDPCEEESIEQIYKTSIYDEHDQLTGRKKKMPGRKEKEK